MPTVAAKTDFVVGRDQVSKRFLKMTKRADKFGRQSRRSFGMASNAASSFKSVLGGVLGANILSRGGQLLAQGIGTATREFVDFDQALTVASAKFPEKISRGTDAFKELQDAARKVGAETQFTATQSAEGLALFAAAGIDAKVSMAALNGVVDLATATSVEFADATETALNTMGQFGLKSKDAATFTGNLDRVSDALVHTVNSAQIQMEDLSETLKFVGPIANTAGAEIEEVNSIIAAMAESGIKGSLAGTALKNMYLRLLEPTPKIGKQLKKLKINLEDDNGEMRKMTDIIGQLEKNMVGFTKKQKTTSLSILFGKRAVAGAAAAMEIGSEKIAEFEKKMKAAGGTSKETADEIRKGLGNQIKILQSTAIELGFKLLEAFVGKGEKGIQDLTKAIRKFDVKPIVEGTKAVFQAISNAIKFVDKYKVEIKALAAAFIAFKLIMAAPALLMAIKGFGLALTATPLGGVAIAIAAISAAVVALNAHLDESIKNQQILNAEQTQTKAIKEQNRLRDELAQTASDDFNKQISLRQSLIVQLKKEARMQELVGESTDKTTERIRSAKLMLDAFQATQGAFFSQNFAGIGRSDDLLPSVF